MSDQDTVVVPRHLSVIYADDLRQEIDGKVTVVGMYQGAMVFPSFPAIVPRLAVFMTAVTPLENPFQKFVLKVLKDGDLIQSTEISSDELEKTVEAARKKTVQGIPVMELGFGTVIGPLTLTSECVFRTRLETEEGTIAGKSLRVITKPPAPPDSTEAA